MIDLKTLRAQLDQPGKSQRELAGILGIDPAAVNRILTGERQIKARELEKILSYIGASESPQEPFLNDASSRADTIPVLGMAEGGEDGMVEWNGDVIDRVPRPPYLANANDAYALYVVGESMVPRYRPGEIIYVHPGRPVPVGCYGVFQLITGPGPHRRALIKELIRKTTSSLVLLQYNPEKEISVAIAKVSAMHRIVGTAEH